MSNNESHIDVPRKKINNSLKGQVKNYILIYI